MQEFSAVYGISFSRLLMTKSLLNIFQHCSIGMSCFTALEKATVQIKLETSLMNRVSTCDSTTRFAWHERDPFWKRLVTGDETWILYQNMHCKRIGSKENRPSTVAKFRLHLKKALLCILWDWKCILYYEHLLQGDTINDKYWNHRPELANRRGVDIHHDNARPPVALAVRQKFNY